MARRRGVSMGEEREANFNWLCRQNLSEYEGLWVSVVDESIVAIHKRLKRVLEVTEKEHPGKRPFVLRVSRSELMTA